MGWSEYKRSDSRRHAGEEFVSLRPAGIAFSSTLVQRLEIEKKRKVSVLVDTDARRVGFRFHENKKDADAFSLAADGPNGSGRWFPCRSLYSDFPWLALVLKRRPVHRRFSPRLAQGIWFIEIGTNEESADS